MHLLRYAMIKNKRVPLFGGKAELFGVWDGFMSLAEGQAPHSSGNLPWSVPLEDLLDLLDPQKDIKEATPKAIELLPQLFYQSGVRRLIRAEKLIEYGREKQNDWTQLEPYERLLLVDLRKRKDQLLVEFENLIRAELLNKKYTIDQLQPDPDGYGLWEAENRRKRKEAKKQLKVWKLRKQQIPFSQIAGQLKISEDLAKKQFYRAFELILGETYEKNIRKSIVRKELERVATDPNKKNIRERWEKLLKFEEIKQQHKLGGKDFKDFLSSEEVENTLEESMYVNDIKKICTKCDDISCCEAMNNAFDTGDFDSWNACTDIYDYIKQ